MDFTINKQEIIQKIKDMPPLAKAVKDRAFKMSINITTQQIEDINAAQAYSISCDESRVENDIELIFFTFAEQKCKRNEKHGSARTRGCFIS